MIGFVIFGLVPMVLSLAMAFTNVQNSILDDFDVVWFSNFEALLKSETFWQTVENTAFMTLSVPISISIGLFVAYLVNKVTVGKRFFRSVFFIPYICSTAAVASSFKMLYNTKYGILNSFFALFDVNAVPWITSPEYFRISTVIMMVWGGTGFCIILYQAALANVNQAYYEAARIDGASEVRVFFTITFPAVSPTTFYLLVMNSIGGMQAMGEADMLAGGGSVTSGLKYTDVTVVKYLYNIIGGYNSDGFGVASAAALMLATAICTITYINFKLGKKWVNYDMS